MHDAVRPQSSAVLPDVPPVVHGLAMLPGDVELPLVNTGHAVLEREDDAARLTQELVLLVPQELTHAGVPGVDDAARVQREHGVRSHVTYQVSPRTRARGAFDCHQEQLRARF